MEMSPPWREYGLCCKHGAYCRLLALGCAPLEVACSWVHSDLKKHPAVPQMPSLGFRVDIVEIYHGDNGNEDSQGFH